MTRHAPISPIYRMGEPVAAPDPEAAFARVHRLRRDAWHRLGVVVLEPDQLPGDLGAQITAWADDEYGERTSR